MNDFNKIYLSKQKLLLIGVIIKIVKSKILNKPIQINYNAIKISKVFEQKFAENRL